MEQSVTAHGPPFDVAGEIGSGAVATVVRLVERATGQHYAGKILHDRHLRDDGANRRFQREAELTSTLVHPNLVRVYGIQFLEGRPVLLMELVEGPNLADALARSGPLSPPQVEALIRQIAEGLAFAHAKGVIHRDLKPANILLAADAHGEQQPKIADFGMARASSFASADKGALTVLGTPQYMAPECLEPLAVDPRTDLYALGCIAFEMCTGAPPYSGATPFSVLEQHRNAAVPKLPPEVPRPLAALITKLLAKSPGDRPQSAGAVVDALRDPTSAALVLVGSASPARIGRGSDGIVEGACARCGAEVLREMSLCFACGLSQVTVHPGQWSVFVAGPGRETNKLDSPLRDRLLRWLRANAAVGIDASSLERKIPRLPFVLVNQIDERSAHSFVSSLQALGFAAVCARGGRLSYGGMVRKINKLALRRMSVPFAIMAAPGVLSPLFLAVSVPMMLLTLPVAWGLSALAFARPAVEVVPGLGSTLPASILERLEGMHAAVEQIRERRHREALRAVVHRVVELSRGIGGDPELEAEMDHALNLATAAALRMDELDQWMSRPDFNPADPQHRDLMHERDMWSARLLDLTATLDAFVARQANARALQRAAGGNDVLDDLRATVEALEEVQQR
jgi:tRNA A-37 threonylcarbamoyl transferase component Bud32